MAIESVSELSEYSVPPREVRRRGTIAFCAATPDGDGDPLALAWPAKSTGLTLPLGEGEPVGWVSRRVV